ncbi:MAG: stage V sporulation protein AD [Firmicutes bacterium]|nr:stage V sporulation protein AD [Bacillota bacterium]
MKKKVGRQSILFSERPYLRGRGTVVGKKEGEGPLAGYFDVILDEDMYGEKSWEKAESKMLKESMMRAVQRAGLTKEDIDVMLSGDLLNQLMSSSFMARDLHIPFLGLYGACSTMTESLVMGSILIDGGFAQNVLAGASSHFCTAERQFRMPVEHGNQRPPSAQWTATAAGAVVVSSQEKKPQPAPAVRATAATIGKVIDAGIKDANQMGAAMAPAAVDTLLNHLEDTGRGIDYYDLIATGDLGFIGKDIMVDLLIDAGLPSDKVYERYDDCGTMLFTKEQDVHGGGSGCGCSASVFCGYLLDKLETGQLKKVLLMSTGAMLSTISPFQGESIPGIAHAIALEAE